MNVATAATALFARTSSSRSGYMPNMVDAYALLPWESASANLGYR
jgi:hypothetical protein